MSASESLSGTRDRPELGGQAAPAWRGVAATVEDDYVPLDDQGGPRQRHRTATAGHLSGGEWVLEYQQDRPPPVTTAGVCRFQVGEGGAVGIRGLGKAKVERAAGRRHGRFAGDHVALTRQFVAGSEGPGENAGQKDANGGRAPKRSVATLRE
jgi:hypothetical protein